MKSKLQDELSNIRETYFEYPNEPIQPDQVVARQNVHYLLGAIDAFIAITPTNTDGE